MYPLIGHIMPNLAAIQAAVGGAAAPTGAGAPAPVLRVYTQQPWNPRNLALWGRKMPYVQEDTVLNSFPLSVWSTTPHILMFKYC